MNRKAFGCILMILGTAFGAGMLALPVVTAHETLTMSLTLLVFSWLIMTIGAFSLLEVNLWLPANTNMISMAHRTLGTYGRSFTWIIYLLLLYSLICAYLSGISDIIQGLLSTIHTPIPSWIATLLGLGLFGTVVYKGIGTVDLLNRGLMSFKLIAYFAIVLLVGRHIHLKPLFTGDYAFHNNAFMVMFTSFGYAIILPSLRNYVDSNKVLLKKVVLVGSLLPLLFYGVWIIIIQGLIPKEGADGLSGMMSSHTNSMLMQSISSKVNIGWVSSVANLFISICAVTAFLGVSICLTDFIADGLKMKKAGGTGILVYAIAFLPPLLIVLLSPEIFIQALNYAGILCILLLIILPLMMLYFGRYRLGLTDHVLLPYGKRLVIISLLTGIGLLMINIMDVY